MAKDFDVYSTGIYCASVCSALSIKETTRRLNAEHPTGITSDWHPSEDTHFRTGQPNPCPCERNPETHKHYLFNC